MTPDPQLLARSVRRIDRAREFLTERRPDMAAIDIDSTILDLAKARGVDERGLDVIGMLLRKADHGDYADSGYSFGVRGGD